MSSVTDLPTTTQSAADGRWTLTDLGPPIGSPDWVRLCRQTEAEIAQFAVQAQALAPLSDAAQPAWLATLADLEQLDAKEQDQLGYLSCLRAENAARLEVITEQAAMQRRFSALVVARSQFLRKLAQISPAEVVALSPPTESDSAWMRLTELHREAAGTLSHQDEVFVASAAEEGSRRWASLAQEVIAATKIEVALPGQPPRTYPIAERYELLWSADAALRKAAYDGLNRTFAGKARVLAQCANATLGFEQAVAARRGRDLVDDLLAQQHRISRSTVETMQQALLDGAPVLHRYLKLKARLLGLPHLGIQDRSAPLPAADLTWPDIGAATRDVIAIMSRFAPALAEQSAEIVRRGWIESEMRPDKRPGGFCCPFPGARQTRVFISYADSMMSVAGYAHELGHAFHAHCNFDQRFWRQPASASLSETASILCEHFLRDAIAGDPARSKQARLSALTGQLDAAVNYMLRIPRDFEFEMAFIEARRTGEVSAERLCDLMRASHARWFGDALQGDDGEPYGWAYNHILMDPSLRLYNFPYAFGYLLSRQIADRFYEQGPAFTAAYVAFLRGAGATTTEDAVLQGLGLDVTQPAYWRDSVALIERQVDDLTRLIETD